MLSLLNKTPFRTKIQTPLFWHLIEKDKSLSMIIDFYHVSPLDGDKGE